MPCKASNNWFVQVKKGDWSDSEESFEDVEVSVVHSTDTHGQRSYGWPSPTKIILEMGDHWGKAELATATRLAIVLATHLNSK